MELLFMLVNRESTAPTPRAASHLAVPFLTVASGAILPVVLSYRRTAGVAASLIFWLVPTFACGPVVRPDGGEGLLCPGQRAAGLVAVDQRGKRIDLRALSARHTVVYFYPKDGTPGCTTEACAFRDVWSRYTAANVDVIGVSADDAASHREFAAEHELPFSLVSDPEHVWSDAFGVGTFIGMSSRVTFVLRKDATVERVYEDVDPGVHADRILADLATASR